jgi:hypothetical protein
MCQCLAACWWVSPVSSTNKPERHDKTELLLKVALSTVKLLKQPLIKLLNGSKKVHHNHSSHGIVIFYDISRARVAQWVGLPNNSYKPITNTAWVRARLDSQPQVIKFTSCLPTVGGSRRVLRLLPPLNLDEIWNSRFGIIHCLYSVWHIFDIHYLS